MAGRRGVAMCERWNCDLLDVPSWHPVAVAAELLERIVADADVCFGRPTIRGHRVWVSTILSYLAEGWTTEAVLVEFPALEGDDVRACLAYAAQLADTRFADLDIG